jgi:ZIP family zinc transporter
MYPILLSIVAFISTLGGGLFVARFRNRFGIITAFAAGVLIAVPLFDLLPESAQLASSTGMPFRNVMYAVAVGFIFLLILERYFSVHHVCEAGVCRNVRHPKGGFFGASELSAHSFMDGFAIGVGFNIDAHVGMIVAAAVILHDFSDGVNTVTVMLHSGNSLKNSLRMLYVDALTPVLGAVVSQAVKMPEHYLVLLLSFFAGGFLYIGASDLLPEAHEKNPPLQAILASLGGFLLIFILTRFLNV